MKRAGAHLVENPFKRRVIEWPTEQLNEISNKKLVPFFEELNLGLVDRITLEFYQKPLFRWDAKKVMRILFRGLNQWFIRRNHKHLIYLAVGLDCDVPVLEALYWARFWFPLSETFQHNLYHLTRERYQPDNTHIRDLLQRMGVTEAVGTKGMYNAMLRFIQQQTLK